MAKSLFQSVLAARKGGKDASFCDFFGKKEKQNDAPTEANKKDLKPVPQADIDKKVKDLRDTITQAEDAVKGIRKFTFDEMAAFCGCLSALESKALALYLSDPSDEDVRKQYTRLKDVQGLVQVYVLKNVSVSRSMNKDHDEVLKKLHDRLEALINELGSKV